LGTAQPFPLCAFIAARSHRPSINIRKRPPEHPKSSVADAMRRSVVTRNYLKKYFGQRQRVAGAGLLAEFLGAVPLAVK
jgi:hypothetical protein